METFNLVRRAAAATGSVLNVLLFGARDDSDGKGGGTDAAPAINAAILVDPLRGGIIEIPMATGCDPDPCSARRDAKGCGGGFYVDPPTQLVADAGVTAIMVWAGGAPDPDSADGGYGAVIERIVITAASKNKTMETGSYTTPHRTRTTSRCRRRAISRTTRWFGSAVGQPSRLQRTTASTVAGSPIVTFDSPVYVGESAGRRSGHVA